MSDEQKYQTIWEEGQGERPVRQMGDRFTYLEEYGTSTPHIVKIERPVPSIDGMEPGTVFIARFEHSRKWELFLVTTSKWLKDRDGDGWNPDNIDPTTIRDVQAPPAMPEGDAS